MQFLRGFFIHQTLVSRYLPIDSRICSHNLIEKTHLVKYKDVLYLQVNLGLPWCIADPAGERGGGGWQAARQHQPHKQQFIRRSPIDMCTSHTPGCSYPG